MLLEPPLETSFFPPPGERHVVVGLRAFPPSLGLASRGEQAGREAYLPLSGAPPFPSPRTLGWRFQRASEDLARARDQALEALTAQAPGSRACVRYLSDASSGRFSVLAGEWVRSSGRKACRLLTMEETIRNAPLLGDVYFRERALKDAQMSLCRRDCPVDVSLGGSDWEEVWDFLGNAQTRLDLAALLGVPLAWRRRAVAAVLLFAARNQDLSRAVADVLRATAEAALHGLSEEQRVRLQRVVGRFGPRGGLVTTEDDAALFAAAKLLLLEGQGTHRLANALFWAAHLVEYQDRVGFEVEYVEELMKLTTGPVTLNDAQVFVTRLVTSTLPGYLLPLFAADAGLLPEAR